METEIRSHRNKQTQTEDEANECDVDAKMMPNSRVKQKRIIDFEILNNAPIVYCVCFCFSLFLRHILYFGRHQFALNTNTKLEAKNIHNEHM